MGFAACLPPGYFRVGQMLVTCVGTTRKPVKIAWRWRGPAQTARNSHTRKDNVTQDRVVGVTVRCRSVLMGEWHVLGASLRPVPSGRRAGCVGWCVFAGSHRAKQHLAYMYATGREWRFNSREPAFFFLQIELLPIGLFCRGKRAVRPPLLCLDSPNPKEQACHVHLRRSRLLSSTEHRTGVIAHRFPRPLKHIKAAHATHTHTSTQTHSG